MNTLKFIRYILNLKYIVMTIFCLDTIFSRRGCASSRIVFEKLWEHNHRLVTAHSWPELAVTLPVPPRAPGNIESFIICVLSSIIEDYIQNDTQETVLESRTFFINWIYVNTELLMPETIAPGVWGPGPEGGGEVCPAEQHSPE